MDDDVQAEADFYNRKVAERAYIGEAYNGATKDWAIVDVPPGTTRVKMDGVGGGSQEVTWQRYNGVRRSKFISDDDVYDGGFGAPPSAPARKKDMWTEITKDLVIKEAIDTMGYEYDETDYFYYVQEYLRYVSQPSTREKLSFGRLMLTCNRRMYSSSLSSPRRFVETVTLASERLNLNVPEKLIMRRDEGIWTRGSMSAKSSTIEGETDTKLSTMVTCFDMIYFERCWRLFLDSVITACQDFLRYDSTQASFDPSNSVQVLVPL